MACRCLVDTSDLGATSPELVAHQEFCAECRAVATQQRALWRTLDEWKVPKVPSDFDSRLWQRLREPPPQPWWRFFSWPPQQRPMPWVAASLTIVLAVASLTPWTTTRYGGRRSNERLDVEQLEKIVEDMDLLRTLTPVANVTPSAKGTSL